MKPIRGLDIWVLAFLIGPWGGTAMAQVVPATGQLNDDALSWRVRSDGRNPPIYVDGEQCVHVGFLPSAGSYQLRTVSNVLTTPGGDPCNSQTWGERRTLTLDFSTPVVPGTPVPDLDLVYPDPDSNVEDAPARLLADSLFHKSKSTTPVRILILTVNPNDGTTTQDTAWELRYLSEAIIARNMDGSREISLSGTAANAELLEYVRSGRKVKTVSRGFFNMPFHLRAGGK